MDPKEDEVELIDIEDNPWIKHLNALYDTRFEQRELPMRDNLIQVNLGDEVKLRPIFISKTLSPGEKEDLIHLVKEFIDVFA